MQEAFVDQKLLKISRFLGLLLILLSTTVLWGWYTNNDTLVRVDQSFISMKISTALCFLFSGIGLISSTFKNVKLSAVCALFLLSLSGMTLIKYISHYEPIINSFLAHHTSALNFIFLNLGKMGANTALCFMLSGIAFFTLNFFPHLVSFKLLGSVITGLGLISVLGYLTGIETAYGWGHFSGMAIHTALGFVVLGSGILFWGRATLNKHLLMRKYWGDIAIGITLFVFILALWQALNSWQEKNIRNHISQQLSSITNAVEISLNHQINALGRMAARWTYQKGEDQSLWEADTQNYLRDFSDIQAIQWVDDTFHVRWVSPLEGNESALNLDLGDEFHLRQTLMNARHSKQIKISSTVNLVQGEKGYLIVVPLFLDTQFEGFIIGVYKVELALPENLTTQPLHNSFRTQLYADNELVSAWNPLGSIDSRFTSKSTISILNKHWTITISPTYQYTKSLGTLLPEVVFMGGLIFCISLLKLIALRRRDQERASRFQQEITQHEQTRKRLIYEESRLRATLKTMVDAVVLADEDGTILSFNEAASAIFGYTEEQILGENVRRLMPEPNHSRHDGYLKAYLDGGEPQIIGKPREVIALKSNGVHFPIYLAISALTLDGKHFFSAVIRDISKQKESEKMIKRYTQELERSNQDLNDFAYVASHDLKAPLQGVLQIATWISEDLKGKIDSQTDEYLELMRNRITRLEKLLDDLLIYSRVGQKQGDFKEVNVADLAIDLYRLIDPPEGFSLVCDKSLPSFVTLHVPFELVLRNLIGNAIKHHHKNAGIITLKAIAKDFGYQFFVSDDGPGIEEPFQKKVFGLFQTLLPRDEVEGSGMGLAIVKKIVENYGGEIHIDSDGHCGTTIVFTWPKESLIRKKLND